MEEKVNLAVVGAFVLIFGTALIVFTLWLSSGKAYGVKYDLYHVYMEESVSGLNLNAPVRYRGVEVGRVRNIVLAPDNVEQVQLTLAIKTGTPIKSDTVAVLQTQGLTGLASVDLVGGSRESGALTTKGDEEIPVIRAGPSLMVRLDASLTDAAVILKNLAKTSEDFPGLGSRIRQSADRFDNMSSSLVRAADRASDKFTEQTLAETQQLMRELRVLTTSLQRVSEQLEQNPGSLLFGKQPAKRGPGE